MYLFLEMDTLSSPGVPRIHYTAQAGLEFVVILLL